MATVALLGLASPALLGHSSVAAATIQGAGSGYCSSVGGSNVGANHDNVYACQGYDNDTSFDGSYGFQCVELAYRFMYVTYEEGYQTVGDGSKIRADGGTNGGDFVDAALIAYNTPDEPAGTTLLPVAGDIVSLSNGGAGHVMVVTGVSVSGGSGTITVMEQNWAGDSSQPTSDSGDNGGYNTINVNNWVWSETGLSGSFSWLPLMGATQATPTPTPAANSTAQVVFDDYIGTVNSVKLQGLNQNNVSTTACFTTPKTVNYLPNYWWQRNTDLWAYKSGNCSTGQVNGAAYVLNEAATTPPYHCQEDVSPWSDWIPQGTQSPAWYNCQISPSPNGVWYGFATGVLVSHS